jgi:hypothetical protein
VTVNSPQKAARVNGVSEDSYHAFRPDDLTCMEHLVEASSASGPRQKSLAGVRHENADADYAKKCGNDLDHHDGPLRPARTKRHGRPNSQKNSVGRNRIAARLMISGNRECRIAG